MSSLAATDSSTRKNVFDHTFVTGSPRLQVHPQLSKMRTGAVGSKEAIQLRASLPGLAWILAILVVNLLSAIHLRTMFYLAVVSGPGVQAWLAVSGAPAVSAEYCTVHSSPFGFIEVSNFWNAHFGNKGSTAFFHSASS